MTLLPNWTALTVYCERKLSDELVFEINDALKDLPGTLPARHLILTRAAEHLDNLVQEAAHDPSLQAELAATYYKIGRTVFDVEEAFKLHQKGLAIYQALWRDEPQQTRYRIRPSSRDQHRWRQHRLDEDAQDHRRRAKRADAGREPRDAPGNAEGENGLRRRRSAEPCAMAAPTSGGR